MENFVPKKLTNNIVDDLLKGRNIKRLSDLINARHAADWLCLIDGCNYQWKTSARSILNNNTGCPNCSGKAKLTNNIVDQRIVDRKYTNTKLKNYLIDEIIPKLKNTIATNAANIYSV